MIPPLTLVNRFAIPVVVAIVYYQNLNQDGFNPNDIVNVTALTQTFDITMRLSDKVLSEAKDELDKTTQNTYYDYIVVGAGSAGAVVASRLSEFNSVLLLEAGGDPNPMYDVPFAENIFYSTHIQDWAYVTVKQTRSCLLWYDGLCEVQRGKALGGCSAVNTVLYNRCNSKDYDSWANFTGDPQWSWENLIGRFNKLEDYHGFYENPNSNLHGTGGPVYVGRLEYLPGLPILQQALKEKNIPMGDQNTGTFQTGFSLVDYCLKYGMRWSTYKSHLEPALIRPNLHVRRYAMASKILFEGNRAVGVEYGRHGIDGFKAYAKKEVIVSCGAYESPKLLMLSGIGPREELEQMNIPVLADLPVGLHMQDHPGGIAVTGENDTGFLLNEMLGHSYTDPKSVLQFLESRNGPFDSFNTERRLMKGYINSKINTDLTRPEVYSYVYSRDKDGKTEIYFTLDLVRTNTTGTVTLASSNYKDKAVVDPNYFADPTDLDRLVDVIEIMLDVFVNSTTFKKYGVKMFPPFKKCADEAPFLSREYWKCYIQQVATPMLHPTSTCRMGPNPTVAVLDSKLRVFGIEGLRVADASVMPFVPSGNTNMPSIMIGDKAADLILADESNHF